jgi:hypothetical protein
MKATTYVRYPKPLSSRKVFGSSVNSLPASDTTKAMAVKEDPATASRVINAVPDARVMLATRPPAPSAELNVARR